MPARQVVLPTSSEFSHPMQLPSRQQSTPVNPLAATLMDFPASVANKRLTAELSPLDTTLTKNGGVGGIMVNQLPLSSSVSTRLQPSFVLNRFHTLSFSISCNSCVCHSYENCRVCTNNSHSGSPRVQPRGTLRSTLARRSLGGLCANSVPFFALSTFYCQLSTSRSPKSLLCHTSEPPGEADKILAGSVGRKRIPFSRYNWRYGCAIDCAGYRRHAAG